MVRCPGLTLECKHCGAVLFRTMGLGLPMIHHADDSYEDGMDESTALLDDMPVINPL